MKHVVMGTAGHIDHGKTTLVKKLTGIDTDRLIEEKKRGMTIELGFASLSLPSGNSVSIVDVPGHEKFVKTMVAGATGIDFVLLVVAADEGIMPQTKEHIDILSILDVKSGVVALTKTDLIEEAQIEIVKNEIEIALRGTTLENISIIPVSANSGQGIEVLIEKIEELTLETSHKKKQQLFRLPVDRLFTLTGHGTIVTGTVNGGSVSKGEIVDILPEGLSAKVRNVQVHNKSEEQAMAGDRCALNLSGIEKSDLQRGSVIAQKGIIKPVQLVDVVLHMVKGMEEIYHNQRVHVHIGTKEVLARIRILGENHISEDDHCYAQLRFEEPTVALRGDRFVIRSYSPVRTLGGGQILFHQTNNRKRFALDNIEALKIGDTGSVKQLIQYMVSNSEELITVEQLYKETLEDKDNIKNVLMEMLELDEIGYLSETDKYFSKDLYSHAVDKMNAEFERLYKKYPYRFQIEKEEIKSKFFTTMMIKDFSALINCMIKDEKFKINKNMIRKHDDERMKLIMESIEFKKVENLMIEQKYSVVSPVEVSKQIKINVNQVEEIIKFLIIVGKITELEDGLYIHNMAIENAGMVIKNMIEEEGFITVAKFKDTLQISRKPAISLLEYFDRIKVTRREDNIRKPAVLYEDFFR